MKRRDFLKTAVVGTAGVAACGGPGDGPAVHAGHRVRWRMASSFPRSLDTLYGGAVILAERVAAMTDGAFDIRVHPPGEIVPGLQVMDAVQQGTVQMGQTASYYYIGKNPALAFDTCVPFGLCARQQSAWLLEGGGLERIRSLYADFGILSFPGGNTGAQMGGWFNRPVETLADLRGLKMRIPGLGGRVMETMGVNPQVIAGGEIYPALERGAIDAVEWVGPHDDWKLGFHQVARYYYYPGWWEPGPALSFLVNQRAWDALPASYQAILEAACHESGVTMVTRYDALNPVALGNMREFGVEIRPFSEELMEGAWEASEQLLEADAAADSTYREIYDHWRRFRTASFDWFGTAELSYAAFTYPRRSPRSSQ